MSRKAIALITIILTIIILSNIIAVCSTILVNDYLWRQYVTELKFHYQDKITQTEYNSFAAMHRVCHTITNDSNICNASAHKIYETYRKHYKALPGFDFDLITEDEKENAY